MWKLAGFGSALTLAGAIKFSSQVSELGRQAVLQDYLAFRCGAGASGVDAGVHGSNSLALAAMHCWGCYAMAGGAAILAMIALRAVMAPRRTLRRL